MIPQPHSSPQIVYALKYRWLTAFYDPVVRITTREKIFRRALLAQSGILDSHRVLDIGCGTGTLLRLAKQSVPDMAAFGVDADPNILHIARRKAEAAGLALTLDQGFSSSLPYPENSFDRAISSLFFHHLVSDEKLRTFREIHRVLKPGGELHVADWGEAQNIVMRGLFVFVQLLDGFETTGDNVAGRLPSLIGEAGFEHVGERQRISTVLGTLSLLAASKPR